MPTKLCKSTLRSHMCEISILANGHENSEMSVIMTNRITRSIALTPMQ